jgi:hypothetical protein
MTNNNNTKQPVPLETKKTEMMTKIATSNMDTSDKEQLIGKIYLASSVDAFNDIRRQQEIKHPNNSIKKVMNESVEKTNNKNNKNDKNEPWYQFWGGYKSRKNTKRRQRRGPSRKRKISSRRANL